MVIHGEYSLPNYRNIRIKEDEIQELKTDINNAYKLKEIIKKALLTQGPVNIISDCETTRASIAWGIANGLCPVIGHNFSLFNDCDINLDGMIMSRAKYITQSEKMDLCEEF